ncbi:formate dehydrogenase accessory sulfurtransferase FdhD [Paenibacillus chartarius]|uniref:Sulfur carrier protein FdhD n=1 Tax=Paenibacillus chartarius TaxID=747481 RepID=A0ABV6DGJ0_9BACL
MADSMHRETTRWQVTRIDDGYRSEQDDEIATEYPLTIRLDGEEFATLVCTPSDLEEMVIGFLASEGVILSAEEVIGLAIDEGRGMADVELKRRHTVGAEFYGKRFIGSCCGKGRQFYLHNDARTAKTSTTQLKVTAAHCMSLIAELQGASQAYRHTGGLHNAALCRAEAGFEATNGDGLASGAADGPVTGSVLAVRSDIGRHNALDKLYGYCLQHRVRTRDLIVAFSGRLSSEVVLKTAKLGAGVLLSNAAPTDLALKLAEELGITAAGFVRGSKMTIYTHPERIVG